MDFLNYVLCFFYQNPGFALLIAGVVIVVLVAFAASVGSGSRSASNYTGQIRRTGSAARQRMNQTSDAYRSNVRDTIRR
jgi:hypothetical protein